MGRVKDKYHTKLALDTLPRSVQQDIVAKRAEGYSYSRLRDYIEQVHGVSYHENTVIKWIKRRQDIIAHVIWGTPEFKNMVAQEYSKVLKNAREVSDVLVDSIKDVRAVSKDNIKDGRIKGVKELNNTAMTFLEYFREIKNVLKDSAGVEDLDVGPEVMTEMRKEGLISIRQVKPVE